ncbi:UvrD-helicase domain-containing protein [Bifidobacterium favimelis]|uniref:UvrD-helicase domain-containing protein n=1 Tax=Bifidobacterium favimelis TaxID=3122979 RepID=A0ABU8ZPW5_9BIFI
MTSVNETGKTPVEEPPLLTLVNLPAGSGKTTEIKHLMSEYRQQHIHDRILAITYTNRARDELRKNLGEDSLIYISTIHSFIESEFCPLFVCKEVRDCYFKWYGDSIKQYLENPKYHENVNRYREKFGVEPSLEEIRRRTQLIQYSHRQFGSRLYSSLSHDQLLDFFCRLCKEFRGFRERIGKKYKLIIVDECQDTNPEVLNTLADIAKEFHIAMRIYGDLMQQIYNKDENRLSQVLNRFEIDERSITNHRSRPAIVNMLNKLYNDHTLVQDWDHTKYPIKRVEDDTETILQLIVSRDSERSLRSMQSAADDRNPITLVVVNDERFNELGIGELFRHYSKCKEYSFGSEHSASEILLPSYYDEAVDDIDRFILTLVKINRLLNPGTQNNRVGANTQEERNKSINEALRLAGGKQAHGLFNQRKLSTLKQSGTGPLLFSDLQNYLDALAAQAAEAESDETVEHLIESARTENDLIDRDWYQQLTQEDDIYTNVKDLPCQQFSRQFDLIGEPQLLSASTQHGVKGESHDSVIFMAQDHLGHPPILRMYDCIKLICQGKKFNLQYLLGKQQSIEQLAQATWGEEGIQPIIKQDNFVRKYHDDSESCVRFASGIKGLFAETETDQLLYNITMKSPVERFLHIASRQQGEGVPANILKKMGNVGLAIPQITAAFRLLYVGCSRAMNSLYIILDKSDVDDHFPGEDYSCLKDKFKNMGFQIVEQ